MRKLLIPLLLVSILVGFKNVGASKPEPLKLTHSPNLTLSSGFYWVAYENSPSTIPLSKKALNR